MATEGNLWTRFRGLPWWGQLGFWLLLAPVPLLLWGFAGRSFRRGLAVAATFLWIVAAISGAGSDTSTAHGSDHPSSSVAGRASSGSGSRQPDEDSPASTLDRVPGHEVEPTTTALPPAPPPPTTTSPDANPSSVATLTVADETATTPYSRDAFQHWSDEDRNGCDTRCEVLAAEQLSGGGWLSVYDGLMFYDPSELDIDHLVPLAEAWRSGASAWTKEQRTAFANDLTNPSTLLAVSAESNRAKGDRDPSGWRPQVSEWCGYARDWIAVKVEWSLSADRAEVQALEEMLRSCPTL